MNRFASKDNDDESSEYSIVATINSKTNIIPNVNKVIGVRNIYTIMHTRADCLILIHNEIVLYI